MLVMLLLLPLSLSMYDSEFDHGGGGGGDGGLAAAAVAAVAKVAKAVAVAAVVAVEDNYRQKWQAMRALTVT